MVSANALPASFGGTQIGSPTQAPKGVNSCSSVNGSAIAGSSILSFGTAGCNLGCKFCQNWSISKSREVELLSESASPEAIAAAARELGCRSVAFTYNDPVIWAEYAMDTARACRDAGVKTVAVTAGYITPAARGPFYETMDAANVDLKGFTE